MNVGLAWILDKTRYFALMSRKWYFILKRQETGTKHVAIVTSKCVPSGIFRRVQYPCQVSKKDIAKRKSPFYSTLKSLLN